jgi:hypothetical protein
LFDATVTDGSFTRIYWIVYYNCGGSGITICWAYIQPVDGLASQLVDDAVRTTGVLAATVTMPLASMLNGPVVNGVTLVLVVVLMLLNVICQCVQCRTTVLFDATSYRWIVHCIDWIVYYNCGCSGIARWAGTNFA